MILRAVAVMAGLILLAAMAHVSVVSNGGYGTTQAVMTVSSAAGVAIGALVIGRTSSDRRYALAFGIAACLACGEAFGLLGAAERLVAQREATQAPAREASALRAAAAERVRLAELALASVPTSSVRLTTALAAKSVADDAATTKAAEKHCSANCRQLLEQQVTAAVVEVTKARDEIEKQRRAAEAQLADARVALGLIPSLPSGTPLADRLGMAPWVLDLLVAGLGSLSANGLGCLLLAFAAHGPAFAPTPTNATRRPQNSEAIIDVFDSTRGASRIPAPMSHTIEASDRLPLIEHVDRFAVTAISKKSRGRASLADVHAAYLAWCRAEGLSPANPGDFAEAIGKLVKAAGITVRLNDKREPLLLGVRLKPELLADMN